MRLHTSTLIEAAPPASAAPRVPGGHAARARRKLGSRTVYLALLVLLAAYGLQVALGSLLFHDVPGVLDLGETAIHVEESGRLERILVSTGTQVEKSAPVAVVTVLREETEAAAARQEVRRIRSEIEGERERALARARAQAAADRRETADLLDRALSARGEQAQIDREIGALGRSLGELATDLAAREELVAQQLLPRTSVLDLRMRRHELEGRREGLTDRRAWIGRAVEELTRAAAELERRVASAPSEALAESAIASLTARLREAEAQVELHQSLGRRDVRAPVGGTVSWLDRREGEVIAPGDPILRIVPDRPGTVIAYPGEHVDAFAAGATVKVRGPDFVALGSVERVLDAARPKPLALLRAYERESVGPAVAIRLVERLRGEPRAGSVVQVSRPRLRLLAAILHRPRSPRDRVAQR